MGNTQRFRFTIARTLNKGRSRPITARQLAALFDCDLRAITQQIERERAAGAPILADCSEGCSGYYLPESAEERTEYLQRLDRRIEAIVSHRDAIATAALFPVFDSGQSDSDWLNIPDDFEIG